MYYTNAYKYGNRILVRSITDRGERVKQEIQYKPSLYMRARANEDTGYTDMTGAPLRRLDFDSMKDAKNFASQYEGVQGMEIFGNLSFLHQFLGTEYRDPIHYNLSDLVVWTLDIETASENGFPKVETAEEEILLITVQDKETKRITTFGCRPFDVNKTTALLTPLSQVHYVQCRDERDMLEQVLKFWSAEKPDIVTGWNSMFYDIPYLVNRIRRIMPERAELQLSPWRLVNERPVMLNGKNQDAFELVGVNHLDYLDLYRKFTYSEQESYRLDHIAEIELGKKKLSNPYETFRDFYTNDWQRFVEYNMVDVELVDQLDDKMRLLDLVITMAYGARCNYADVFSAVKTWDCIITNYLDDRHIIVPQRTGRVERRIEGGYVTDVTPGAYRWVCSIDATSLYPSLMIQYNMSPETFIPTPVHTLTVDEQLEHAPTFPLAKRAVAANGYSFDTTSRGFFPAIIEEIFAERQHAKQAMIAAKKAYETLPATPEHTGERKQLLKDIAKFNNIQMARKIQMNSLYGAMANVWFRFYDDRIAEAVTMTGQLTIKTVGKAIDTKLNEVLGTHDKIYAFYSDTDSCYITLDALTRRHFSALDLPRVVTALNKVCQDVVLKEANAACEELAERTQAFVSRVSFKREIIADLGLWVAKKRYAVNVHDSEGVRYDTPKIKVMGLELVRSSTPQSVKDLLRGALTLVLNGTEQELQAYVADAKTRYLLLPPEAIATPSGVSKLDKYLSPTHIYQKSTPMHIRAALLYNHHIKKRGLEKKYELIRDGEKIKYLYLTVPNPLGENTIGFPRTIPAELDVSRYVDYITMFTKTFLTPLTPIIDCLGWSLEPRASLDELEW